MQKILTVVLCFVSLLVLGNNKAIEIVAGFEGFRPVPYRDVTGYSIGYGTNVARANGKTRVSKEEAKDILASCLEDEEDFVSSKLGQKTWVKLDADKKAALLSMSYNCRELIGPKLIAAIKAGNVRKAAEEISYGHKGEKKGLVLRRFKEASMFDHSFLPTMEEFNARHKR